MKQNLDTLKTEIDNHLKTAGFVVFHGFSRGFDVGPQVHWDTQHHPDYKAFADVAKQLGVKLIVVHHRQFDGEILERALDQVEAVGLEYDDQRRLEARLRDLKMYEGFTCAVELSFDYNDTMYLYELRTDWYSELNDILDELDIELDEDEDDDETFGGYYSRN
jgi:hypothetical protein